MKKITQEEIAKEVGISQARLSQIVSGKSQASYEVGIKGVVAFPETTLWMWLAGGDTLKRALGLYYKEG